MNELTRRRMLADPQTLALKLFEFGEEYCDDMEISRTEENIRKGMDVYARKIIKATDELYMKNTRFFNMTF